MPQAIMLSYLMSCGLIETSTIQYGNVVNDHRRHSNGIGNIVMNNMRLDDI